MNSINLTELEKPFKGKPVYFGHIEVKPDYTTYDLKTGQLLIRFEKDGLPYIQTVNYLALSDMLPELCYHLDCSKDKGWKIDFDLSIVEIWYMKFGVSTPWIISFDKVGKWLNESTQYGFMYDMGEKVTLHELLTDMDSDSFIITQLLEDQLTEAGFDRKLWHKISVSV